MGVRAPKPATPPAASAPAGAAGAGGIFKLKRGQLLFSEGDASRAIYVLRNGMIRLYLKKGDSIIELDTVRSGQVLGELAFLDGMPRSASAEALTDCELLEISGPTFLEALRKTPDWLKMLLKAVVGRLRSSNTRIRQLESASTAFDYSNTDGKRVAHYVFLSPSDILRLAVGVLAVGGKAPKSEHGHELRIGLINRYCQQILSIPAAKITSFIHILENSGLIHSLGEDQHFLRSPELLEETIAYLNEENLLDPAKRHDLSVKGFAVMGMIARHLSKFPKDPRNAALTVVNLGEIKKHEPPMANGSELFRIEEFAELVKIGYASSPNIKGADNIITTVESEKFLKSYTFQRVVMAIGAANEEKRAKR